MADQNDMNRNYIIEKPKIKENNNNNIIKRLLVVDGHH